jgi:hypothetical protein
MQAGSKCWMFTQRGALMPCTFLGEVFTPIGLAFYEVESTSHKVYTASPANVFDDDTGRAMLIQRRAEGLVKEGYQLSLRADIQGELTFRVYCPKKHGVSGGYILREIVPGHLNCTCPAYAKEGQCKHQFGCCGLLYTRAHDAEQSGKSRQAETYREIAGRIASGLALVDTPPQAEPMPGATLDTRIEVTQSGRELVGVSSRKPGDFIRQNRDLDFP